MVPYLPTEILCTIERHIYHQRTLYSDFCRFNITRNNKCTVHSFQDKYYLVRNSIIHLNHILFKDTKNALITVATFSKNLIRTVFSLP